MEKSVVQILTVCFLLGLSVVLPTCLGAQFITSIQGTSVNVRSCPGTQCGLVGQLNTGEKCLILEQAAESRESGFGFHPWYRIRTNSVEGYVFGAFVQTSQLYRLAKVASQPIIGDYIAADNVNVRDCGATHCPVVTRVNAGDQVEILGATTAYPIQGLGTSAWVKIAANGTQGFVHGSLVDLRSLANPSPAANPVVRRVKITGDNVNVRSGAGIKNAQLFAVNRNDQAELLQKLPLRSGEQYPWYQLDFNGRTGYVYGRYVVPANGFAPPPVSTAGGVAAGNNSQVKIWAVVVGIDDYSLRMNAFGVSNLRYCAIDAKRVYQFLKNPQGGAIPDHQISLLMDHQASVANIKATCRNIYQKAGPDDLIFFYFSGHGGPNYFCAHDRPLKHQDLSSILAASNARHRVCVADACFSGTWSKSYNSRSASPTSMTDAQLTQLYYNSIANASNGTAFLMSSDQKETSLETPNLGQGLFTYFYIRGLKGGADKNGNKIITLQELYDYLKTNVTNYAARNYNHSQHPTLNGQYNGNLPMAVVR